MLRRELAKLETNLTGVADMAEQPGAVVIVDCVKEANAVKEAVRLHIPIVAIVDTNADPEPIDYVIPGNDDSVRGVELILGGLTKVIKDANAEYSAKAAEASAKREAERTAREASERAARAERKAKIATAKPGAKRPSMGAKKGVVAANVKAAARAAKEAAEIKAKADLAAKRQAKVVEAQAAVDAAAAPAAEAPVAEVPAQA